MSKLKFEIVHFLVILVLLLLNVGGCGGQPLSSKFILKVKKQNPLPKEHVHIMFQPPWIVFVGILSFHSLSRHYKKPCRHFQTALRIKKIDITNRQLDDKIPQDICNHCKSHSSWGWGSDLENSSLLHRSHICKCCSDHHTHHLLFFLDIYTLKSNVND